MKEKLNLLEQEKQELSNQFKLKMSEVQQLKMCIKIDKEEFYKKCEEVEQYENQVKTLKDAIKASEVNFFSSAIAF